jgi:plastocyanin
MRVRLLAAALAGATVGVVPALAANQSVQATPSATFAPKTVTVNVGESVTFTNGGGTHNVHFEDGQFQQPPVPSPPPWTVSRTFTAAGTFPFFCDEHGRPGGGGMSGVVVVAGASGGPPPSTTTAPGADVQPPSLASLRVRGRRRAIVLTLRLSEDSTLAITVTRRVRGRQRRVTVVRTAGRAGRARLVLRRLKGRRVRRGRYRLSVVATDAAGNSSAPRTARAIVRR